MMMHNRRWSVEQVGSAEELAEQLKCHSWCGCCGFELEGYLWLNDSTSPDAVQEYAVVRKPTAEENEFRQVESISVGWCSREELLEYIREIHHGGPQPALESGPVVITRSAGDLNRALGAEQRPEGFFVEPQIEKPARHGRCQHCA